MPIPGTDLSRCRCGTPFKYIGYGKRLCPTCMRLYKARRANTADQAKCRCGAVLGLQRQAEGIKQCGVCDRRDLEERRRAVLEHFADSLINKDY